MPRRHRTRSSHPTRTRSLRTGGASGGRPRHHGAAFQHERGIGGAEILHPHPCPIADRPSERERTAVRRPSASSLARTVRRTNVVHAGRTAGTNARPTGRATSPSHTSHRAPPSPPSSGVSSRSRSPSDSTGTRTSATPRRPANAPSSSIDHLHPTRSDAFVHAVRDPLPAGMPRTRSRPRTRPAHGVSPRRGPRASGDPARQWRRTSARPRARPGAWKMPGGSPMSRSSPSRSNRPSVASPTCRQLRPPDAQDR